MSNLVVRKGGLIKKSSSDTTGIEKKPVSALYEKAIEIKKLKAKKDKATKAYDKMASTVKSELYALAELAVGNDNSYSVIFADDDVKLTKTYVQDTKVVDAQAIAQAGLNQLIELTPTVNEEAFQAAVNHAVRVEAGLVEKDESYIPTKTLQGFIKIKKNTPRFSVTALSAADKKEIDD